MQKPITCKVIGLNVNLLMNQLLSNMIISCNVAIGGNGSELDCRGAEGRLKWTNL